MEKLVRLHDKSFRLYKSESEIMAAVRNIAHQINEDYIGKRPLLIPILNGSFIFTAELVRELKLDCEISFVKAASYEGTQSTGTVEALIGLNASVEGRHIIVIEDIVDTGRTLSKLLPFLYMQRPASLKICSMLYKPFALQTEITVDYVGMEIPNDFIVGFGLDYRGLGRNLRDIYQIVNEL